MWDRRDTITDGTVMSNYFSDFCFLNYNNEEQSLDQNQEEGWEVQDGSTRIRKVVNSGYINRGGGQREA